MSLSNSTQPPIINCHTHVFVGANLPPYLAKTFLPYPLYKWLTIPFILKLCRWWYLSPVSPNQWKHQLWYKRLQETFYTYRSFILRHSPLSFINALINLVISYHAVVYVFNWLTHLFIKPNPQTRDAIAKAVIWLNNRRLLFLPHSFLLKLGVVLFTIFFIAWGRKLLWFLLKKMWGFLSLLPNEKTVQFMARYLNIGRFAYYRQQGRIFIKLKDQYPIGSGFVLLPMDMAFMDAGTVPNEGDYAVQMRELAVIKRNKKYKDCAYPFIFIDPRRKLVGTQVFFDWKMGNPGTVELKDCFIKDYLEKENFSGFKIYPALGYYPFDGALLPLWKYAADHQLPIMTHAIRGTIFYRGTKKKEWGHHPVFQQADGNSTCRPLLLPELKNRDFINNFTHPLNYLCLVEEPLLRIVVSKEGKAIQELFGYTNDDTKLLHDLSKLKLCFGHFGGDDEWQKFFENDRDDLTSQLLRKPGQGLAFTKPGPIQDSMFVLEQVWKHVDWYSIIRSMMLQYPNLYADISYIVHSPVIFPLLKQTLQHPVLQKRVLFGTDFYVVRNHKSEKEMLAYLQAALSEGELDRIARYNPREFLNIT